MTKKKIIIVSIVMLIVGVVIGIGINIAKATPRVSKAGLPHMGVVDRQVAQVRGDAVEVMAWVPVRDAVGGGVYGFVGNPTVYKQVPLVNVDGVLRVN